MVLTGGGVLGFWGFLGFLDGACGQEMPPAVSFTGQQARHCKWQVGWISKYFLTFQCTGWFWKSSNGTKKPRPGGPTDRDRPPSAPDPAPLILPGIQAMQKINCGAVRYGT